jgi:hypothetical protein
MYPHVRQLTTPRQAASPIVSQREREADAEARERLTIPDPDAQAKEHPCR